MASIYVCSIRDEARPRVLELCDSHITAKDIDRLKQGWPKNLSGIYFDPPLNEFAHPEKVEVLKESYAPRVAIYLVGIADKLRKIGQLASAFKFYDLANAIVPNPKIVVYKAKVLFDLGQVDRAAELLENYLENHPLDAEALYLKGRIALTINDFKLAKEYFKRAFTSEGSSNIENRNVQEAAKIYLEFTSLLVVRDSLHTFNFNPTQYRKAIGAIKDRAIKLQEILTNTKNQEIAGIGFSLDSLVKTFENWDQELLRRP
ncbi:MAG: tetratricopeptide repeat protein [Deltaproteobacteria bacterium]|nr:tetratricopeptide repeat protein [Deltaproteobacteria bacterium]